MIQKRIKPATEAVPSNRLSSVQRRCSAPVNVDQIGHACMPAGARQLPEQHMWRSLWHAQSLFATLSNITDQTKMNKSSGLALSQTPCIAKESLRRAIVLP